MPPPFSDSAPQIDAVITWVDGEDPTHKARRLRYLLPAEDSLHENGINPHRWACGDELSYCLRSIENHAPWIGTIHIVTDAQTPDLSHLSTSLRAKIRIIDHRDIFKGYEHALPTFNSLAIESMLWRIEGLSERFIYFNDDVFLTAPLRVSDVFDGDKPVLRGKWVDLGALGASRDDLSDPSKFHDFMQRNAALLLGYEAHHVFACAHVVFPMRRTVLADMYARFKSHFEANIAHRFRDISQFHPQSLHNGACLHSGSCVIATAADHLHLRTNVLDDYSPEQVRDHLRQALTADIKFLCVNDLRQIEAAIPDVRDWIETAIASRRVAA
jgi:Stealth protein CR2, conserved region 2/Stealth protein CR1, conserved region 1